MEWFKDLYERWHARWRSTKHLFNNPTHKEVEYQNINGRMYALGCHDCGTFYYHKEQPEKVNA